MGFSLVKFGEMPDADADGMTLDELESIQDQLVSQQMHMERLKTKLHGVLLRRYEADTKRTLRDKDQDGGTVTFPGNDGRAVKVTIPKLVEWDQNGLRSAVDWLAKRGADLDEYVGFIVKVKETKYKAWPDPIRKYFDQARTVKQGKVSIKIERKGD